MSLIAVTDVRKSFGANEVLKGIDLDVEAGEVIAIIGKSGSGKSTLLRCINGLETIDDGSISVDGAQLLHRRRPLACAATQGRHDLPAVQPVSASDCGPQRDAVADDREKDSRKLKRSHWRARCSSGWAWPRNSTPILSSSRADSSSESRLRARWRCNPARCLCDEITSALDPELVNEVLAVVGELAKEGMTLMMVTHEMRFAREVCDRVVFMHLGRVHEIGPPEEVFMHPRTPELKQFLGMVQ